MNEINSNRNLNDVTKIKKNGIVDKNILSTSSNILKQGGIIFFAVDSIYGILATLSDSKFEKISSITKEKVEDVVIIVSNFKMLEKLCNVTKLQFDFLHKIWPGEVDVILESRDNINKSILVRMPRTKYCQQMFNEIDQPLIFSKICNFEKYPINENSVILSEYSKYVDYTVIVDDICKEHSLPSVIDIRSDKLSVVYEGRILSDDIRSLFFLGKMN